LVTIVAMGSEGRIRTDEDEQCALYLRNLLLGVTPDHDSVRSLMLAGSEARKYGNPATPHFPVEDRDMAATIDSHNFAIRVTKEQGLLVARKESA
jgi:2-phosphosulfolactate phosphatase